MTVDDKVIEARFFLGKLTSVGPTDEDSIHYLSAFLSSSRSIMNQLLRDYARRYELGFGDDEPLDGRRFRDRAQTEGREQALLFVGAYERSIQRLRDNRYYEVLALRRHINVTHGTHALVHNLTLMTQDRVDETESLSVRMGRDPQISMGPNAFRPVAPELETGARRNFNFEDFPGEPVPHICSVYLKSIVDEVTDLRSKH